MSRDLSSDGNDFLPVPAARRALLDASSGEPFDRLARVAAAALQAPAALVAVLSDGAEVWKGAFGIPAPLQGPHPGPSFLDRVIRTGEPLALANAGADARFAGHPLVTGAGIVAFLGVPIGSPCSPLPACLAVLDSRVRVWTAEEVDRLRDLSLSVLAEVELFHLRAGERSREEEYQRERQQKAALLAGTPQGLLLLDQAGRVKLLNATAARFFRQVSSRPPEPLVGKSIWEECPEVADSAFARECLKAEAEQRAFRLESYLPGLGRWLAFHGTRLPEGLCVTFEDVTERVLLERSLRDQAEQLAEADRGRGQFLLRLAHELRDALTPIRNALNLWEAQDPGGVEAGEARALAAGEVRNVSQLLEDLLEVSQCAPDMRPRLGPLDLGGVVGAALRVVLTLPATRGRNLLVNLPPEPLMVAGDRSMLERVLGHLLENAAKFTSPGGQIWLDASSLGAEVVLRVRDSGSGIAPELLPHIFDQFMRAERAQGRLQEGVGIGLTLVRCLVEQHGGRVEAHSEGPGRGSEFVVRLPALTEAGPGQSPAGTDRGNPGRRQLRILVVDNIQESAQSVALLLRMWGHAVRVAIDPFAALEDACAHPPDVALLDLGMPGMDGYELARRLRAQSGPNGTVLVALTGYSMEEDRRRAREVGFDHFFVKPVAPEDLRHLLELQGPAEQPNLAVT
jgi:two-component system CheB/CheR fusion protein